MWQASYLGPDGLRHSAGFTFQAKVDAERYLSLTHGKIIEGKWKPSDTPIGVSAPVTLKAYAAPWLADRTLKPRTREHYQKLLDHQLSAIAHMPLKAITPLVVRQWHAELGSKTPTLRAHAYGLLRTILASAVHDGLIPTNPCHIRGAGNSKRVHRIKPLTLPELQVLTAAMPEKYQAMVLLAAWCGLRFGELAELRRSDIKDGKIHVRRAVVRANGKVIVSTPKSDAGIRDVSIPPHLVPAIKAHISDHAQFGKDGLLFAAAGGGHLAPATLYKVFYPARAKAGRPDLRWHDLRHVAAVLAAQTGATLAQLMARLGHSTSDAALRYQHAAEDADLEIARKLSEMAGGK
jgi:integrase